MNIPKRISVILPTTFRSFLRENPEVAGSRTYDVQSRMIPELLSLLVQPSRETFRERFCAIKPLALAEIAYETHRETTSISNLGRIESVLEGQVEEEGNDLLRTGKGDVTLKTSVTCFEKGSAKPAKSWALFTVQPKTGSPHYILLFYDQKGGIVRTQFNSFHD